MFLHLLRMPYQYYNKNQNSHRLLVHYPDMATHMMMFHNAAPEDLHRASLKTNPDYICKPLLGRLRMRRHLTVSWIDNRKGDKHRQTTIVMAEAVVLPALLMRVLRVLVVFAEAVVQPALLMRVLRAMVVLGSVADRALGDPLVHSLRPW